MIHPHEEHDPSIHGECDHGETQESMFSHYIPSKGAPDFVWIEFSIAPIIMIILICAAIQDYKITRKYRNK